MKSNPGRWMIVYGLFLIGVGLLGFASNPEKARTALISGGTFGGLSVLWGWLMLRGRWWAYWAACGTAGFLLPIFCWRATVSWQAVAAGDEGKWIAAVLITSMGLATVAIVTLLIARRRAASISAAAL